MSKRAEYQWSLEKFEAAALRINEYWRKRGFDAGAHVVMHGGVREIVSNCVNGIPSIVTEEKARDVWS